MSAIGTKEKAIKFRKEGYSYSFIKERLGVSKSTLSDWLSDIPFAPNKYTREKIGKARLQSGNTQTNKKNVSIERIKKEASADIGKLSKRDLFLLGIGLYIGEGSKTQNIIRITNSDPKVILLAIEWFTKICNLGLNNFTLAIHLYPDNNIDSCRKYWSRITKIPLSQFGKTQVDIRKKKKNSVRTLKYGTAQLTIRSNSDKKAGVQLARKIKYWMETVMRV